MGDFRISPSELAEKVGAGINDFQTQLAEETRKFACELWNLYPAYITNNHSLGTSLARGYMESLCAPHNPPPPNPPPPLTKGQCEGVSYQVNLLFVNNGADACNNQGLVHTATLYVTGKINGLRFQEQPELSYSNCDTDFVSPPTHVKHAIFLSSAGHTTADSSNTIIFVVGYTIADIDSLCQITDIIRTDGLPDNCAIPEGYPTTPVPPPVITKNFDITVNNNTTINFSPTVKRRPNDNNFTFPFVFAYGDFDVSLDLGGFNFSPTINFGNNDGGGNGDGTPPPPPINNGNEGDGNGDNGGGGGGGGGAPPSAPNPFDPDFFDVEDIPEEDEPVMEDIENLSHVTIEVKSTPANAKTELGSPGDNIYYPGFIAFRATGFNFPRDPIHYLKTIYYAPEGATGFAIRRYPGFRMKLKVYTKKIPAN
jgi:hypothetical protein